MLNLEYCCFYGWFINENIYQYLQKKTVSFCLPLNSIGHEQVFTCRIPLRITYFVDWTALAVPFVVLNSNFHSARTKRLFLSLFLAHTLWSYVTSIVDVFNRSRLALSLSILINSIYLFIRVHLMVYHTVDFSVSVIFPSKRKHNISIDSPNWLSLQ